MNIENHELWQVYSSWYENNKVAIKAGNWKLVDLDKDSERGLNLLTFLDQDVNSKINKLIMPRLSGIIGEGGWLIPDIGRHVTVLDIIPHNAGKSESEIKSESLKYANILDKVINSRKFDIKIVFSGVFASPDGITLQGFPVAEDLQVLRNQLRQEFSESGLLNLEENKYIINTAHVALVKFVQPVDANKLFGLVDQMRKTSEILFTGRNLVLNISSRYDKVKTIDKIKEWRI